ncbi:MAG: TPM domain-containing protein [Bacteroidales bacterium]
MTQAAQFFRASEKEAIGLAIRDAEKDTSGEIRVHLDNHCREDVMDRAAWWFAKLNMHQTARRNGVLFYLAVKDRKFAILGDAGINAVIPEGFWDEIKEGMSGRFGEGKYCEGLCDGIRKAGQALQEHFPYQKDDKNELSDEISIGS